MVWINNISSYPASIDQMSHQIVYFPICKEKYSIDEMSHQIVYYPISKKNVFGILLENKIKLTLSVFLSFNRCRLVSGYDCNFFISINFLTWVTFYDVSRVTWMNSSKFFGIFFTFSDRIFHITVNIIIQWVENSKTQLFIFCRLSADYFRSKLKNYFVS